jgi:hypothetical protein
VKKWPKPCEKTDSVIEWPSWACCEAFGISPQQLAQLAANGTLEKIRYGVFDSVATTKAFVEHLEPEVQTSDLPSETQKARERLGFTRFCASGPAPRSPGYKSRYQSHLLRQCVFLHESLGGAATAAVHAPRPPVDDRAAATAFAAVAATAIIPPSPAPLAPSGLVLD